MTPTVAHRRVRSKSALAGAVAFAAGFVVLGSGVAFADPRDSRHDRYVQNQRHDRYVERERHDRRYVAPRSYHYDHHYDRRPYYNYDTYGGSYYRYAPPLVQYDPNPSPGIGLFFNF